MATLKREKARTEAIAAKDFILVGVAGIGNSNSLTIRSELRGFYMFLDWPSYHAYHLSTIVS